MIEIPKEFYHASSEQLRGVLGQGYIASIITEKKMSKSLLVLTNLRLYQIGKVYEKSIGEGFVSSTGKKVISINDITGTGYQETKRLAALVAGLFLSFFGLVCLAIGITDHESSPIVVGISCFFFGVVGLYGFFATRVRWFIIEYAGGAIAAKCHWYTPSELEEFQKKISLEKDIIAKEYQNV